MANNQGYLFDMGNGYVQSSPVTEPADPLCRIPIEPIRERRFLVGFPSTNWDGLEKALRSYGPDVYKIYVSNLRDINGGINVTQATSNADAVSNVVFRRIKDTPKARAICRTLRDSVGYEKISLDLSERRLICEGKEARLMTAEEEWRYMPYVLAAEASSMTGRDPKQCLGYLARWIR